MKVLIFSDTHLGKKFEEKKLIFLQTIISEADKVIIAGDFWEGLQISFDEFVNSPWKTLFPLLKKKQTVYLFGNHDKKEWANERISLFSTQQNTIYEFRSGKNVFVVEHGDRFSHPFVTLSTVVSRRIYKYTGKYPIIGHIFERYLLKTLGKKIHHNLTNRGNKVIKERNTHVGNNMYIFGHTHAQELDRLHHFANTGMIRYGIGQYIIVENGELHLYDEVYA